ncbi:hypothetical protein HNQ96_000796 [Aminobacter lissarensis]|jgi:hypothetical protein|uniref:Uncharacterized protein n=1 Tax=Aminobacter carboxidus TaxID=376165 RepID=A0A8E2BBC2_9HYPH|nr:hypothetical protein [Aminobacter lissarensis]
MDKYEKETLDAVDRYLDLICPPNVISVVAAVADIMAQLPASGVDEAQLRRLIVVRAESRNLATNQ